VKIKLVKPGRPFDLLLYAAFLLSAALVRAQTAGELEGLLDTGRITYAQAAYFTLASAPGSPPSDRAGAFALALERGWLPAKAAEGPVTLGELSLLMMRAFALEGGFMYRLFPGPRYAYREMTRRGFIEGRADPGFTVSGERFLQILGKVLSHTGDAGASEAPLPEIPQSAAQLGIAPPDEGRTGDE
jgi:hypothetical protein